MLKENIKEQKKIIHQYTEEMYKFQDWLFDKRANAKTEEERLAFDEVLKYTIDVFDGLHETEEEFTQKLEAFRWAEEILE